MRAKKPVAILDGILLVGVAGFFGLLCYRLFFTLNYRWNWPVIPTYLVRFDQAAHHWVPNVLLEGLFTTVRLSVWAMLLAVLLGFAVGLLRLSPRLFCRLAGRTYVESIRNTPPLVLVFIFYYFVSDRLFQWLQLEDLFRSFPPATQGILGLLFAEPALITRFFSGVLTLALFQGAYIAEIVRAGLTAIDTGQWEAGKALGLTRVQLLRLVIFPQALRIMLPPLANEFINTIKWSSIVSIISIQELTFQGLQVMASTQATIEVWLTVSSFYLVLCLALSLCVRRLERRLARPDAPHRHPHDHEDRP
jgi:polar amino acid transport system permease protein